MEKYALVFLTMILTFSQFIYSIHFNSFKVEIVSLRQENQSMNRHLDQSISEIERLIKKGNSPIEIASISYGTIKPDNLTIEVSFIVVPKELTPTTKIFLEFNEERVQLDRNNSLFSLKKDFYIFSDNISPLVIIEDNEKQVITQEPKIDIYGLRDFFTPMVHLISFGELRFINNDILVKGQITLFIPDSTNVFKISRYKVVYFLDNDVIGQQDLVYTPIQGHNEITFNLEDFHYKTTSSSNSIFSIVLITTNEFGFETHRLVSQARQDGNNHQFCYTRLIENIYSPTKELLWQSRYGNTSECILPTYK
jgi:hypothetical protein